VLDRAGVTGDDGPSHNGIWDLSVLSIVPGMRVAVPRDGQRVRELLREAVAVSDGPTALRYPKGGLGADIPTLGTVGSADLLVRTGDRDVLIVAVGAMAALAMEVAERLTAQGIGVTVVDPRWIQPLDPAVAELARGYRFAVSIEDSGRAGGFGDRMARALRDAGVTTPFRDLAVPQAYLAHAKRAEVLADAGLTAQDISRRLIEAYATATREADSGAAAEGAGRHGVAPHA
jgi:1-deoxy-D-xylulose-5-phosphate synthase